MENQNDIGHQTPHIMHDWNMELVKDVQRFYYSPMLWRKLALKDYQPRINSLIKLNPTPQP